jgi:hypothetical protein
MPPRHGKCLVVGTPVLLSNGTSKPIEEVTPEDKLVCINDLCNFETDYIVSSQLTDSKMVYTVTLSNGCYIRCLYSSRGFT